MARTTMRLVEGRQPENTASTAPDVALGPFVNAADIQADAHLPWQRKSLKWIRSNVAPQYRLKSGRDVLWRRENVYAWASDDRNVFKQPCETHLYFIRNPVTHMVKIGVSEDVSRRLAHLQMANGIKLEVLGIADGLAHLESVLHVAFAADRQLGEWFTESPALLALAADPTAENIAGVVEKRSRKHGA